MKNRKRWTLLIFPLVILLLIVGCGKKAPLPVTSGSAADKTGEMDETEKKEDKVETNETDEIETKIPAEANPEKVKFNITDVKYRENGTAKAKISVTLPDFEKIHARIQKDTDDFSSLTPEELENKVNLYAEMPEYSKVVTITGDVKKRGDRWVPASEDMIDDLLREQLCTAAAEEINRIGVISIGVPEEGEE